MSASQLCIRPQQMAAMQAANPDLPLIQGCPKIKYVLRIYLIFWQAHRLIPWPVQGSPSPHELGVGFANTIWKYFQQLRIEYGNYTSALADFGGTSLTDNFSRHLRQEIGHAGMVAVKYEEGKESLPPETGNLIVFSHTGGDPGLNKHPAKGIIGGTVAELNVYDCLMSSEAGLYDNEAEFLWRLNNKEQPRIKLIELSGIEAERKFDLLKSLTTLPGCFAPDRYGLNTMMQFGTPEVPLSYDSPIKGGCANLVASILKFQGIDLYDEFPQGGEFAFYADASLKGLTVPILLGRDDFIGDSQETLRPDLEEFFQGFPASWPKMNNPENVHFWDPSYLYASVGQTGDRDDLLTQLTEKIFHNYQPVRPTRAH